MMALDTSFCWLVTLDWPATMACVGMLPWQKWLNVTGLVAPLLSISGRPDLLHVVKVGLVLSSTDTPFQTLCMNPGAPALLPLTGWFPNAFCGFRNCTPILVD